MRTLITEEGRKSGIDLLLLSSLCTVLQVSKNILCNR
jgi:hypothetical protein